jgi:hypothetical protein
MMIVPQCADIVRVRLLIDVLFERIGGILGD